MENVIKIDSEGTGCSVVDWTNLAEDRDMWWVLVNTVMNMRGFIHWLKEY